MSSTGLATQQIDDYFNKNYQKNDEIVVNKPPQIPIQQQKTIVKKSPTNTLFRRQPTFINNNDNDNNKSSTPSDPPSIRSTITIDLTKARSNTQLLKMCIGELGWNSIDTLPLNNNFDIIWLSAISQQSDITTTLPSNDSQTILNNNNNTRINKFPCN
jgi:hypothetical protein